MRWTAADRDDETAILIGGSAGPFLRAHTSRGPISGSRISRRPTSPVRLGLLAAQLRDVDGNAETKLPEEPARPAHWLESAPDDAEGKPATRR
jgi:hypothetical protein